MPNPNWFGKETITFTVSDPERASASTKATFEVVPVNDPPKFKPIPQQVIEEKKTFPAIDLTKFVTDPDNTVDELKWSIDGVNPYASAAPAKSSKSSKKDKKKRRAPRSKLKRLLLRLFLPESINSSTTSVKRESLP